ncbi:PREDICTED: two-component response regulator ORR26-like [Nelumbo nucifera]|uniref:Response regulatory domain-containing protein n=2 Tax=Nelumbo nucifera TaxID=4432 RepID=A0A822YTA3_NELNU|nr:PREDICTED: two-component response regulator ORR26-like [Nelumbo nucifera]DAD34345.1 TPA_asm: hypothetical protein HUJ06_004985 [Nelumbo nucifera]
MESGFASPRADAFPAGLRVLVVDDDPTWLKILEKMLKKCSYEVTTCCLARDALDMLRERKDRFDIVISDVNMPDMDGFKLLEHVGLEMDLPVIMMSVDGETSRVMKGVQHGACDYLLKPVRMKELRNIWQHVFRKKIHEVKEIENHEIHDDVQMMRSGSEEFDDGHLPSGLDLVSPRKRKDMENKEHEDQELSDPSAMKKARVVWSVDLHQKFVNAVNQIGFDKVGPKKILDLMKVPWLTRENVASHLQKYRLYLSRLQKQNESKAPFCGTKQSDFTPKDTPGSFGIENSIKMHQNNAANSSYGYCGNKILLQNVGSEIHENDLKGIISFLPITEPRKALAGDVSNTQKSSNGSRVGLSHSFGSLGPDVNYPTIQSPNCWNTDIPVIQFAQKAKQEKEPYILLEDNYMHLPPSGPQNQIQADGLQSSPPINSRPVTEKGKVIATEIKPLCTEYGSNHVGDISRRGQGINLFSVQADKDVANAQAFGYMPTATGSSPMRNQSFDQIYINNWNSLQPSIIPEGGSFLSSSHEDLEPCSLQGGYGYTETVGFNNEEILAYEHLDLTADPPSHLYDGLRFNCDYPCDSMEYPLMDRGLFIA